MPPDNSLWQRLGRAVRGALFPRYWLHVLRQEPLKVVLNSDGREVTVDGKQRVVRAGEDEVLASFDAVQAIDVAHHPRNDAEHKPEHWSLTLYLGRSRRAFVGRSRKHEQVIKAAGLLARMTSKPLRELQVLSPDGHIPSR